MIYIASPGTFVSGGPETLHQAAYTLKNLGYDVRIYYESPLQDRCKERFAQYNVESAEFVEDSPENIFIIPETSTFLLRKCKRIKICIWWLSRDNYFEKFTIRYTLRALKYHHWPLIFFPAEYVVLLLKGRMHIYHYHFEDEGRYYHAYNCEYAHQYILEQGVPDGKTLYLCGPLNDSFFKNIERVHDKRETLSRENIILYNPKKGIRFTNKVIAAATGYGLNAQFIALQNMTPDQIAELMLRSKIYMDFGEFPGPERIPREAVTMGCNIITSRNGSAGNEIDVPIPMEMKFDNTEENIPVILEKLEDMLVHYDEYYPLYDEYRKKVADQVPLLGENLQKLLEMMGFSQQ